MTREEIIQIVEEASTRSIIMFLEREDNDTYPNALPSARIVRDNVVFSTQPTMKDGSAADWRMRRSKEDLLEGYTWFSIGTFRGNGTQVDAWTDPVLAKIGRDGAPGANGAPGGDGADGTSIEYIFRLAVDETQFNDFATPYSDPNTTDYVPTVDNGGVPESDAQYGDWADHPDGVTLEHKVEAMCYRKRDIETHQWSEFYGPYKWSVWGNNGRDGDGVEYIFRLATLDGEDAEAEYDTATGIYRLKREYWPPTDQASYDALTPEEKEAYDRTDIEYYPEGWIDDPLDVNDDYPVQFVSVRKYDGTKKKWGFFSEPTCWNKIPLTDSIVTAFTALAFCVTAKDISNYKPVGGSAMDPDPDDFDYEGEHITWSDSIPSVGNGFVWMTTSVWRDGEITEKGWSYPMKVNDSPGFQAEYSNDYPWDSAERPKLPNFGEYNEDEAAWRAAAEAAGCGIWKDCKYDDPEHYISDPAFMATCQKKDGVWTDWVVTKIKGENGLSPVYLHIGNDTIAVGIDDNNKTVASVQQTITAEIQIGGDELDIDPTKAIFKTIDGGNLPSGFEVLNPRVDTSGKKFMVEIIVPQDFDLTQQFKIKMSIVAEGFDAYNIIRVVGVPGGDGASYSIKIDGGYIDIDRTFTSTGACVYTPAVLKCHGERIIGLNDPIPYGYIKYSVSTNMEDYKFDVLDVYTPQEGVFDYTDGIVIDNLQDHQNLKAIYLYLVNENNLVIDTEIVEIDTEGEYFINLETDKIVTDNGTVKPSSVKVWTGYRSNKTDPGTYIDSHVLKYYINGDSTNMKTSVNRNNNAIQITSLDGWNISTTKTITFVLTTTNGAILTDPKSISVTEQPKDGENGKNGTSITDTFEYFKAAGENETVTSPDSSHSKSQITGADGWSISSGGLISETKPMLWSFLRIEYNDGSAKHLPAFVVRYLNPEVQITYESVKGHIETKIQEDLNNASTRLGQINKTDALINTDKGTGLIELLTSYKDGTKTSFADIIADASKALINQQVGAAIWGEGSLKTLTSVGQKIDGLEGKVETHATALFGADGNSGLSGTVNDVREDMDAMEGTLTNTVAKATYILVKGNETFEYAAKDGDTKINAGESIDAYNTRMRNAGYTPKVTAEEMSIIKQESNKISLIVGDNNNYLAAIRLLAKAPLKKLSPDGTTWVDVTSPDGSIPEGSRIELDAGQIHINGSLLARDLKAAQATIVQLVAGQIKANSLETGNISSDTGVGAIIQSGKFEVWKAGTKRIEFGVDNQGELVLKFFYASGREAYNLGPAGFNKI